METGGQSLVSLISSAARQCTELKDRALEYMQGFQELRRCVQEHRNPLMEVLNYIDQHLDGKLTLPELAQMSCMSVPSFCKKFKEQTKMTVTQYINEKTGGLCRHTFEAVEIFPGGSGGAGGFFQLPIIF